MISFRYHVVSLVASLFALAAGIAVGSGPLQRDETTPRTDAAQTQALTAARARLGQAEQGAAFDDAYATATAGALLEGKLEGRAVTLLSLPGADGAAVDRLADLVAEAGGSVTARVEVGKKLLDVANRQLVAELATQMQASARRVRVPADATGYEHLGALLAHALVTDDVGGSPLDDPGSSILAGLSTAELATSVEDVERRGSLVLVVGGSPYGGADERQGAGSIVDALLTELDDQSAGVVLAGPAAAAREDGVVGAVRADPAAAKAVSTVDVVDRVAGEVVAVLALAAEADGTTGHYGSEASPDGPLPTS